MAPDFEPYRGVVLSREFEFALQVDGGGVGGCVEGARTCILYTLSYAHSDLSFSSDSVHPLCRSSIYKREL